MTLTDSPWFWCGWMAFLKQQKGSIYCKTQTSVTEVLTQSRVDLERLAHAAALGTSTRLRLYPTHLFWMLFVCTLIIFLMTSVFKWCFCPQGSASAMHSWSNVGAWQWTTLPSWNAGPLLYKKTKPHLVTFYAHYLSPDKSLIDVISLSVIERSNLWQVLHVSFQCLTKLAWKLKWKITHGQLRFTDLLFLWTTLYSFVHITTYFNVTIWFIIYFCLILSH